MKKSKLNLNNLKIESFVTDINGKTAQTINGGFGGSNGTIFNTNCCSDADHCFSINSGCGTIIEKECHKY